MLWRCYYVVSFQYWRWTICIEIGASASVCYSFDQSAPCNAISAVIMIYSSHVTCNRTACQFLLLHMSASRHC